LITFEAPAKINLTLEVLRRRPDGYHEIRSILQAISLYDTLYFSEASDISVKCNMPGWSVEKSLVGKAVQLLQQAIPDKKGAAIEIKKRIPLLSGLGGDSSDAAAALRGLNRLWKLRLSPDKLLSLAASLGADVPFFLREGTVLVEGRGEILKTLPSIQKMWIVLVLPDIPVPPGKTARMYAALKPSHFTDGSITQKLTEILHKDKHLDLSLLFNSFENIAFDKYTGLSIYKEHLIKLSSPQVHLAGSGPTLFTMLRDKEKADNLYTRCKDQDMKVFLVSTI
jgi:4-diphosphocytidyl-2-C-methyl-D-erythritol kinase